MARSQLSVIGSLLADDRLALTSSGLEFFDHIGVDTAAIRSSKRPKARRCLDWTERRHHLAGAAGAGLLDALLANRWVTQGPQPRSLRVTNAGKKAMTEIFAIPDPAQLMPSSRTTAPAPCQSPDTASTCGPSHELTSRNAIRDS